MHPQKKCINNGLNKAYIKVYVNTINTCIKTYKQYKCPVEYVLDLKQTINLFVSQYI